MQNRPSWKGSNPESRDGNDSEQGPKANLYDFDGSALR